MEIIRRYSLGAMFIARGPQTSTYTVPFITDDSGAVLRGHISRAGTMEDEIDGMDATIVFMGPGHYISPSWYKEDHAVPTWNYASATARGKIEVLHGTEQASGLLDEITEFFEGSCGNSWRADWNDPAYASMIPGIIPFTVSVTSLEGRMKMSQNHPYANVSSVADNLEKLGDRDAREVAGLMRRQDST